MAIFRRWFHPLQAQASCKALDILVVLARLNRSFQTRLYRVDSVPARISSLNDLKPSAPSTRIGDSLKQLSDETSDLPIGAVVLLSDGDDNTGGIDLPTPPTRCAPATFPFTPWVSVRRRQQHRRGVG